MFFIIWRGKGVLVLLSFIVSAILTEILQKNFIINEKISIFIAVCLCFYPLWVYGNDMNKPIDTGYINKITGVKLITKNIHTFFFIPIQYWGIGIPAIVGIITIGEFLSK